MDSPNTMVSVMVVSRAGIVVTPSNPMVLVPTTVVAVGFTEAIETGSITWKNPEIVMFWLAVNAAKWPSMPRTAAQLIAIGLLAGMLKRVTVILRSYVRLVMGSCP